MVFKILKGFKNENKVIFSQGHNLKLVTCDWK